MSGDELAKMIPVKPPTVKRKTKTINIKRDLGDVKQVLASGSVLDIMININYYFLPLVFFLMVLHLCLAKECQMAMRNQLLTMQEQ